ncbi:MAG: hypothetical protein OES38_00390 [Gammaproteobacteria bacterium]|nr:hypothetical protein [Gammaproteobacteria bacterium]
MTIRFVLALTLLVWMAPQTWAASCAEPSPSVAHGEDFRTAVDPKPLTASQIESLRSLFMFADRRWKGNAVEVQCVGTESDPRPKTTDYRLRGDGEGNREGMTLEIEMSHDDGVRREIMGLQIEDGMLKLREGGLNSVDILSLRPNEVAIRVAYGRRRRFGGVVHMESFWWFGRMGNDLVIRSETYSASGLAGEARWRLKPR